MGLLLFKQKGSFVLSQETLEGFDEIGRFANIEELKNHLNNTGQRITWFGESLSDIEVLLHLRKYEKRIAY